jgi:hypothetical protein
MRIVLFTSQLWNLSGGEVNVRDWALGLRSRGHDVTIYTPMPGRLAEDIRAAGVPVVRDPSLMGDAPDIMFGSGINDALAVITRFPKVPVIQITQQWDSWAAFPCPLPQVMFYVAVSTFLADMLINEFGLDRRRVKVVHNAVDLARLRPRPVPLPIKPERAIVFAKSDTAYLNSIRKVCVERSIELEVAGPAVGRIINDPLAVMAGCDLVIGTGRTAIEGAVAGAAVLVGDHRGLGGMLLTENLRRFRMLNFGLDLLKQPIDVPNLCMEIDKYNPADAAAASVAMGQFASLERQLELWEAIFTEAIEEFRRVPLGDQEWQKPLSSYLASHLPRHGEPSPRHSRFYAGVSIDEQVSALNDRVTALESEAVPTMPQQGPNLIAAGFDEEGDSSPIASLKGAQRCSGDAPGYIITAVGEPGEHYIAKSLPPIHGHLVLSLEIKQQTCPLARVQVLNQRSEGIYADFDLLGEKITTSRLGRAKKIKAGREAFPGAWEKVWLSAVFPAEDGPLRFIIQLADDRGHWSFKPRGEALLVRNVRLGHVLN